MKDAWLALFLALIYLTPALCTIKCNPNDDCLCFPSPEASFEFQCPKNYPTDGGYLIHTVSNKSFQIDCSRLEKFDFLQLPNVTSDKMDKFRIRFCPFPEHGFKEVLDKFSIKEINLFNFESSDMNNVTLTKEAFEGLEELESLGLNDNGLVHLEEDVFANTPNLTSLELQNNRIVFKADLFKAVPFLESLDISENHIETFPEGLLQNLDKLKSLHMWNNDLKVIEDSTFLGLASLKSLEVSLNKIEAISQNAFNSLLNLRRINLSMNNLQALSGDLFKQNTKLELILMNSNTRLQLPEYLFSNLSLLGRVELVHCKLEVIPENVFKHSPNVKHIKLSRNQLKNLPKDLFRSLVIVEEIYLGNNLLESIDDVFTSLQHLKVLSLEHNQIKKINENAFKGLNALETLDLQHNHITTIHHRTFYKTPVLKSINLSHNRYSGGDPGPILLEDAHTVESVDLSHNLITDIDHVITLINKIYLNVLNLSYNRITGVVLRDLQPLSPKLNVNLEYNNITTIDFNLVEEISRTGEKKDIFSNYEGPQSVISLSNNPLDCDCHNYDLLRFFRNELIPEVKVMFDLKTEDLLCANPPELRDVPVDTLSPKLLICQLGRMTNTGCPNKCTCSWRPFDNSMIVDCSNKNFTEFPDIDLNQMHAFTNLEMHLEGNYLDVGPDGNLTGYENITKLFLSYNRIKKVTWLPPKLKVLALDNNQVSHLDFEVLDTLNRSRLENLTLDHNPWSCDCKAENLTRFLRQHPLADASQILCINSTKRLIDLNRNDLCREWQVIYLVLIMMAVLLTVAVLFALYYRYQQELKVWLFAHNMCLWWVTENELDKDKTYDAFISYSHKDEDFVVQNLLPVLEGGPIPYKLCLHYRNWVPGEFITTQVTNSVLDSRRTLVVLSPSFLESVWGKMEFRTAHTQAMTEGRARVIILLYGDVDMNSLDDELKSYLKTNTYVKWGDPYFWNKLKYALPHSKQNASNNNQKIANVMNCIDDKFNLVTPASPSPGTTPPVLDASILRKHPLNFVPSSEMDTPPAESGTLLVSTCL